MKPFFLFFAIAFISACGNEEQAAPATESKQDAARTFIRYALDGKFDEARKLMVVDSMNQYWMGKTESSYQSIPREDQRAYRESTITVYDTRQVNDSVAIITYSNSFKNRKDSLRMVRTGAQWLVDLKYTFQPIDSSSYAQ